MVLPHGLGPPVSVRGSHHKLASDLRNLSEILSPVTLDCVKLTVKVNRTVCMRKQYIQESVLFAIVGIHQGFWIADENELLYV